MSLTDLTPWSWTLALAGLAVAEWLATTLRARSTGSEAMRALSAQVSAGASALLRRQAVVLAAFAAGSALLLWLAVGDRTALAFVAGAASAAAIGWAGTWAATHAGVRAAEAARLDGEPGALRTVLMGAAVLALTAASIGLLGPGLGYLLGVHLPGVIETARFEEFAGIVAGYAAGASAVALLARVGGGIFHKAADVAAHLVAENEGMGEDDPRNPAAVADHVGDCVGGTAGVGVDLFESYAGALVASVAIAATSPAFAGYDARVAGIALPILAAAVGLLVSLLGIGAMVLLRAREPAQVLRNVTLAAVAVFLVAMFFVVRALGFDLADPQTGDAYRWDAPYWAMLVGALAGLLAGLASGWYAAGRPVRRVAEGAKGGVATVVIAGLAVGMESTVVPLVAICIALSAAHALCGLFGIAVAAVGMLSTVGVMLAVAAYGPIADDAGGVAEMCHLGPEVRRVTDRLDAAGSVASAVGRGWVVGSAALAAVALFSAYASLVGLGERGIALADPRAVAGLFLGGAIPFLVAALTVGAVGRTAQAIAEDARRQIAAEPGIREGTVAPDAAACVDLSARAALRGMLVPGLLAVLAPVAVGALLGVHALGGLVAGTTLTGVLLAFFLGNAGEALDRARVWIETSGGRGTPAHGAAVIADTVGDPLKDAAGPAMGILVKVMAAVSLVIAPWLARLHGIDPAVAEPAEALLDGIGRAVVAMLG